MSEQLSDLEITRACAEAIGYKVMGEFSTTHSDGREEFHYLDIGANEYIIEYNPLHDDEQAMALLIMLLNCGKHVVIENSARKGLGYGQLPIMTVENSDVMRVESTEKFRRAICLCVAKMHRREA